MTITIKTAADVEGMRIAGRLASEVLDMLTAHVKPGITTDQLDQLAHKHITEVQGAIPAPLNYAPPGYTPYPKSICTSINHQVCHGIPNDRPLKNGDIVNIDVTVIKDRSLSAQWEHTIPVTDSGYEVLTLSEGSPPPPAFVTALAPAQA